MSGDALMFVSFDADGDLVISRAEIEAGLAREFARADVNADGELQPIEYQNWALAVLGGAAMGPYRLDFDRNVDNVITRAEFDAELNARASDYDHNDDGVLTRAEFVRQVGQTRPPS
jgi:Ca2+-binding EF-hand superfamily protein